MINKYRDHLLILPEDDANKDLALGFVQRVPKGAECVFIESVAGGWASARERLVGLAATMQKFSKRRVLVLVDFDRSETRREDVLRDVPDAVRDRVFLVGVRPEPEALQNALGHRSREAIGAQLAEECLTDSGALWQHELLAHNAAELDRLQREVLPFLR